MAQMYPKIREKLSGPMAEQMVYKELVNLPEDYIIFHSVNWVKKRRQLDRNFTFYENDFVILHKKYGILFLEVKGGGIYFKDDLMHQVNTVTGEDKTLSEGNDPLNQADRGIQHYRAVIKSFLPYAPISIEPLIWFPSCTFDRSQLMPQNYYAVSFAILDGEDLFEFSKVPLKDRLEEIFAQYGADNITSLTDRDVEKIRKIIAPDFDLVPIPSLVRMDYEEEFIRLTNEQAAILDYLGEQNYVAIQGAAGTGKTVLARRAAENFGGEGRRVLFLCYNKLLYSSLSQKPLENVEFYNIDLFVTSVLKMPAGSIENRIAAYDTIDMDEFPYDDVIIDEAQDFGNAEIHFFKDLCALREGHFYVFFDKNQVVLYDNSETIRRTVSEDGEIEEEEKLDWIEKSECRLVLSRNCRNTDEIAKTSYSVIQTEVRQKPNEITGDKPNILFAGNNEAERIGDVVRYYINKGYKTSEIAILSMTSLGKSVLKDKNQVGGVNLKSSLEKKGVLFTTARKYKGLENKVIIIIDIDENCFRYPALQNVFYVACSRASQQLTLVIGGGKPRLDAIASQIDLPGLTPQGKISLKTKTVLLKI